MYVKFSYRKEKLNKLPFKERQQMGEWAGVRIAN